MADSDQKRMQLIVPMEMYEALQELSLERGQAASYIMREAIGVYLARAGKKIADYHPGRWGGARDTDD